MRWFFAEGDARAVAAMRIAYGSVLLFMIWDVYPVRDSLLGHAGYFGTLDPRYVDRSGPLDLLFHFDSAPALTGYFALFGAAALSLTVGLFSRVSMALAFYLLLLFQARDPYMLFGADGVLLQVSIWMLFMRSGRAWSLDAWLRRWRGAMCSQNVPLWPIRAIQIQIALVYFVTGLTKAGTEPWRDGSALYYALHGLGNGFFPDPLRHKLLLTGLTYATLWVEISFPFLVFWGPTRWIALLSAAVLHAAIDAWMMIRFFGPVMYLGLLSFVRSSEWLALRAWVLHRWARRRVGGTPRCERDTPA